MVAKKRAEYSDVRKALTDWRKITTKAKVEVESEVGYRTTKRIALDIGKEMSGLESIRKKATAPHLEAQRALKKEADELKTMFIEIQTPFKVAYKDKDEKVKREHDEFIARTRVRIAVFTDAPGRAEAMDSDGVAEVLSEIRSDEVQGFGELTEEALKARNNAVESLTDMLLSKAQDEERERELAELRKRQEQQDERERERREEEERREREHQEQIESLKRQLEERDAPKVEEPPEEQKELSLVQPDLPGANEPENYEDLMKIAAVEIALRAIEFPDLQDVTLAGRMGRIRQNVNQAVELCNIEQVRKVQGKAG